MAAQPADKVIDFHAHILVEEVAERSAEHNVFTGFGARRLKQEPGSRMAGVFEKSLDPGLHPTDMDGLGIDTEVLLSMTVIQSSSWAPPALDLELNARVNDEIGRWVAKQPDRFIGSCTLPLQDLSLAVGELERSVRELGARVVQVPSHVHGRYLGDLSLRPFWEAVRDLDVVVLLHPEGIKDPWFQEYSLWNSVGQAVEEARALASMVYEGLLEQIPELKIVVAHGGGFLPHYYGRMDRNVYNMPQSARNLTKNPGEYISQLYFDTCLYDPGILNALVERYGATQLIMGADYPVGEPDPVGFVRSCERLSRAEQTQVLGTNAARLLNL